MKIRLSAALLAAAVISVPAGAQAATKDVSMGMSGPNAEALQKTGSDANKYYPSTIQIRVGDSVRFAPNGFHNVDLPKRSGKPVDLFTPAGTATGVNDAAGAAFWFNGQPTFGFNPTLLSGKFGKTTSYSGAAAYNSGLPLEDKPKPAVVKFTKKGTFNYFCDIHPGMKGQVQVKSKKAKVPSKKADAARVKKAIAKDLATAKKLAATKAPTNTVLMGAYKDGVDYFGFLPAKLTVPVGTTVSFKMASGSREVHSATTGPGADDTDKQPTSYVGKVAATFEGPGPFAPEALYPSDVPPGPAALSPTLHGNGFWNTGVLDTVSASPLAASSAVTFAAAGTYNFVCVIHTFMKATVTAT